MKKFRFKLEKLLDLRIAREKAIKTELAKLLQIQNIEKTKQNELRQSISERKNALRTKFMNKIFLYNEILMHERFVDTANKAINIAEQKIQDMEPDIRNIRKKLIEASKEKKVIERLKEKQLTEFNYNYNREISKENDDINQNLFQRLNADDFLQ